VNEESAGTLKNRLVTEMSKGYEALLDSSVSSPFKYNWPENIKSIIAVPFWGKGKAATTFAEEIQNGSSMIGLMVAINRIDKPDFDSTDAKLFNSVANGCAIFIDNGRLFKDLEELFIGSLKALTNSIDAKDQYTRGHSERVAFISRWIAERIGGEQPLKEEEIQKIYLAGLLHDIGKFGIDDSVLRKKGKLNERELTIMRNHPAIGAGILSEIKQMHDIIPAVLYHHERPDGKGYPNGLVGEQIPLVGKIVGLADSFDAMTSKRTYKGAMSVEKAKEEIKKKLGTQFDEDVGTVFINSDIYQLWDFMQDGLADIYRSDNLSEYGVAAVGTLVR
jgi:HD-GYP domain-containing protein (c-di-GMP phosphodiesterase class II)